MSLRGEGPIRRLLRRRRERLRGSPQERVEVFENVTSLVHYFREKRIRIFTTTPGVVIDRACDFLSRELGVVVKFGVTDILADANAERLTLSFDPPVKIKYLPTAAWISEMST